MIPQFTLWRAAPRQAGPRGKRSNRILRYAIDFNLQIRPIPVLHHRICVRATRARLFTVYGGLFVTSWLPDLNDQSRAFMKTFVERRKAAPSDFQVATYSVVRSYLKAYIRDQLSRALSNAPLTQRRVIGLGLLPCLSRCIYDEPVKRHSWTCPAK